jgi:NADH dehydrogenase FAD-containing subunit
MTITNQITIEAHDYAHPTFNEGSIKLKIKSIILDLSPNRYPRLYQVPPNFSLEEMNEESLKFNLSNNRKSFLFLGNVSGINKEKKIIEIYDGSVIEYEHLICIKGIKTAHSNEEWEEYFSSIETLLEALKLRKHMKTFSPTTSTSSHNFQASQKTRNTHKTSALLKKFQLIKTPEDQVPVYITEQTKTFFIEV